MSRLFSGTSFDQPKKCEKCGQPQPDCRCLHLPPKKKMSTNEVRLSTGLVLTPENSTPPKDQLAKVRTEKRKGGRFVTVISGMDHPANDLSALCTELKQLLSVGGSVQGRTIEIQGDHVEKTVAFLTAQGLKAHSI